MKNIIFNTTDDSVSARCDKEAASVFFACRLTTALRLKEQLYIITTHMIATLLLRPLSASTHVVIIKYLATHSLLIKLNTSYI